MNNTGNPNLGSVMLLFHNAITRGLEVSKRQTDSLLESGDSGADIGESFGAYLRTFSWVLNMHHSTEDDVVFPYLKPRIQDAPYDTLLSDHMHMALFIKELQENLDEPSNLPQPAQPLKNISRILSDLTYIWYPHIETEKIFFYDSARINAVMTADEQIKLLQEASQHVPSQGTPSVIMPFVFYNLPLKERAEFESVMPPELTQKLIPAVWKPEWSPMQPFFLE